jgi:hypothetical protein
LPRRDQAEARGRHNPVKAPPEFGVMPTAGTNRTGGSTGGALPRSARSPGAGIVSSATPPFHASGTARQRNYFDAGILHIEARSRGAYEQPDRRDFFLSEPIRAERDGWSSLP